MKSGMQRDYGFPIPDRAEVEAIVNPANPAATIRIRSSSLATTRFSEPSAIRFC